jgi:hypothetical protein
MVFSDDHHVTGKQGHQKEQNPAHIALAEPVVAVDNLRSSEIARLGTYE